MSFEGQQLGRYRLQEQLGSGGMGEVYLATDAHINRQVAVKIIRDGATAYPNEEATREAARLFQREMRAVAVLDHPHILPLYDYGEETAGRTTLTYMVMPYRKEGSLADWLQQRGKRGLLSLQEVTRLVRQAVSALQQAHNHNIIHQDVKPSNFLIHITEDEPDRPNLQLADFGVAKFTSATSSMSHAIRGTPSYMAPEQWEGAPVPATDQYALAIMAYELLTGRPPFQGGMGQMMYQHFNVQPQPPGSLNPSIPADLDTVLLHALAKKPEQRFANIAAFSRAFQEAARSTDASTSTIMKTPPVQPSPPLTPRLPPTPPLPAPVRGNDLHATLAISPEEALGGTTRTLTLPGGRSIKVSIPAGVYNGMKLRRTGLGEPSPTGTGEAGALIITLTIKNEEESRSAVDPRQAEARTYLSTSLKANTQPSESPIRTTNSTPLEQRRGLSQTRRRRLSRKWMIALIALVAIVVLRILVAFYFTDTSMVSDSYLASNGASASLVINDSLSGSTSSWDQGSNSLGSCQFTGGAYHVITQPSTVTTPEKYYICSNSNNLKSNFTYEVSMTIIRGYGGGIAFRVNSTGKNFYYFTISQDGSYKVGLAQNNQLQSTLKIDSSSAINTGLNQINVIAVVANGNNLDFYINQQHITSISDSTYTSGQISVIAYDISDEETEVAFNNTKVWTM